MILVYLGAGFRVDCVVVIAAFAVLVLRYVCGFLGILVVCRVDIIYVSAALVWWAGSLSGFRTC